MNDPPHIVGANVVAPHQQLDDRIVQHLFECWFGIHGVHDLFPCRLGLAGGFHAQPAEASRGTVAETARAPVPWYLAFDDIIWRRT